MPLCLISKDKKQPDPPSVPHSRERIRIFKDSGVVPDIGRRPASISIEKDVLQEVPASTETRQLEYYKQFSLHKD